MNKLILSAIAMCTLTFANAQEGTTASADQPQTPPKSVYHQCLLNAGTSTWQVLGLDEQQATRVAAVQARYKAEQNPAPVVTAKKGKATSSKKAEATVETTTTDVPMMPLSVDDEFRAILTAQQLALWEKQCTKAENTGTLLPAPGQ